MYNKKLYIIDAVNFLFRAYYAIGPMTNPQGFSTNALFGFIRSIYKLIEEEKPTHLIAVFDGPDNKKSRQDLYADYKSHRKAIPEDLFPQLEKAIEWCTLAGIPNLSIPEVEADDTIGSIALWGEKQGATIYICSSDKDFAQLVGNNIFILNTHKENLILDRKGVKETFGVFPEQMIDYLAIVGDSSDNIPGLEGFGPKTASSLLERFGTLDNLLEHPEEVPGEKKQHTLKNGKEIALLSRKLATIHTSVKFPKEENFFHLKTPHLSALKVFYSDMHFLSLLKQLENTPQESKGETLSYKTVITSSDLEDFYSQFSQEKEICFDTETTDIRPLFAKMVGIGFSSHPQKAWYIPLNGPLKKEKILQTLSLLLQNKNISFYGHNIKYDLHILLNENLPLPVISFDTMVASYLVNPNLQKHNLDALSLEKLHKTKIPIEDLIGKGKTQISMQDAPLEKVAPYCCEDTDCTVRLKEIFEKELQEKKLTSVMQDVEIPLIPVLTKMEQRGIFIDLAFLKKMSQELAEKIFLLEQEIFDIAGEKFNLNSPKQLSIILFEKMGIKPPKKTKTGFSTSADVLEEIQHLSPLIQKLLAYRSLEKLRSTYVDSLPLQIHPKTHRIHCTFNQSGTATGRLSCQDPNLQNIPVRTEEGNNIRKAFLPEAPFDCFLSADYSQIELRLLAHLSEDPALLKAFHAEEDVHAYTASLVFDVPLKKVTPEMRQKAKAVNFGILYGQQTFGLSQGLGISYQEASSFIDTYFKRYHKVKEFLEFCKESVRKTGKAVTLTGRQRPIPDIHSKNPMVRAAAERLAVNTPLQGTAADLIKMAMIQIDTYLKNHTTSAHMLLQIHDELLFEVQHPFLSTLSSHVTHVMENVVQLKIPLKIHISIGKNWGEC